VLADRRAHGRRDLVLRHQRVAEPLVERHPLAAALEPPGAGAAGHRRPHQGGAGPAAAQPPSHDDRADQDLGGRVAEQVDGADDRTVQARDQHLAEDLTPAPAGLAVEREDRGAVGVAPRLDDEARGRVAHRSPSALRTVAA